MVWTKERGLEMVDCPRLEPEVEYFIAVESRSWRVGSKGMSRASVGNGVMAITDSSSLWAYKL